jgi:hypothetical protein
MSTCFEFLQILLNIEVEQEKKYEETTSKFASRPHNLPTNQLKEGGSAATFFAGTEISADMEYQ